MKTVIFKDYSEFCKREDKSVNGVSELFAKENPNFEKENETNEACWNCSGCSDCSDCSRCSHCSDCSDCSRCSGCSDCSGCSRCSDCSDCLDCSHCSDCSDCSGCSDCSRCSRCSGCSGCSRCLGLVNAQGVDGTKKESYVSLMNNLPKIDGIHNAVLNAIKADGCSLEMGNWHTCETTHCRAGWVVHIAGSRAKELESYTSTEFAAMQIYKASSNIPVPPTRFYGSNESAMVDIERCAELERNQVNQ